MYTTMIIVAFFDILFMMDLVVTMRLRRHLFLGLPMEYILSLIKIPILTESDAAQRARAVWWACSEACL